MLKLAKVGMKRVLDDLESGPNCFETAMRNSATLAPPYKDPLGPSPRLLVILLVLSSVVFAAAVPATRSSMIGKMNPLVQDHLAKNPVMELSNSEEDMNKGTSESRMMMDIVDYPGTKPNPAHDPKSPGKP
ncbi:unnamed protein product [Sphenostylis stenocarpa]|uniref:Uncharacterized protein n=1 Tax=Sphenostylis stenocarpa TaxID=92480 RepID=A0AA86VC24_9FABA|nr:unnamed protein product [Sphenostylis stenocarpa]